MSLVLVSVVLLSAGLSADKALRQAMGLTWEDGVGYVKDKNAFVLGLEPTRERWVEVNTRPSQSRNRGYGYLWWLFRDPPDFAALSYLNTNVYVFPRADLVIVRPQARPCDVEKSVYESEAVPVFRRLVRAVEQEPAGA